MKTFVAIVALVVSFTFAAAAAEEPKVLELKIDAGTLGFSQGKVDAPVVIGSIEDLEEVIGDKDLRRAILKQVDLKTRTLVYFAWSGSGKDSLKPRVEDRQGGVVCSFTYKRGLTEDLRPHHRIFALPRDLKWEVRHARG